MSRLNFKYITLILIFGLLFTKNSYSIISASSKELVVVIDPGHGGKDPGAVNKSIREKDIVLSIGLKLGKLINENHPDVKVIFTRNTDVFIPLIERSRLANKNKADLFISIHANSCPSPSIRGTETFLMGLSSTDDARKLEKIENSVIYLEEDYKTTYDGFDPNSAESYIIFENIKSDFSKLSLNFAAEIQQQFKYRGNSPDRGVKQAGFLVLRQSSMPSVLVEAGFVSNQNEANYLNSDEGQQQIANSIFEAFRKFKGKRSGSISSPKDPLASVEKVNETIISNPKDKDSVVSKNKEEINTTVDSLQLAIETKIQPVLEEKPILEEKVEIANTVDEEKSSKIFYSVQIAANTTPVEPSAINFKGLKNVRREKTDKYFRYYVGSENSVANITSLFKQVKQKFPQAFIVSFVNGIRTPYNGK